MAWMCESQHRSCLLRQVLVPLLNLLASQHCSRTSSILSSRENLPPDSKNGLNVCVCVCVCVRIAGFHLHSTWWDTTKKSVFLAQINWCTGELSTHHRNNSGLNHWAKPPITLPSLSCPPFHHPYFVSEMRLPGPYAPGARANNE